MHDVRVKMKDGREFVGPMWTWRPEEGWFSIAADDTAPDRINLREVESAIDYDYRGYGLRNTEPVDLLDRAKKEGWDGT